MAERTLAQNVAQAIADFKAIKDIANEATNDGDSIPSGTPTSQYAGKIDQTFRKIYQTGHTDGYNEGYIAGGEGGNTEEAYQEGFNAGYKDGVKSEYDRFWDAYQEYGNRTIYNCAFGSMWTAETFKPKYDIKPTNAYMMFHNNMGQKIKIDDFVEFCKQQGIEFDLSNSGNCIYALGCLHTKRFGVLDVSKCTTTNYTNNMFYTNTAVITIDKFISSAQTHFHNETFAGATNLENITMEGVVGTSISFYKNSKLTKASLESIISVLKDFSGTSTTATLTLHADSKAKLSEADIAIATQKGWTVA